MNPAPRSLSSLERWRALQPATPRAPRCARPLFACLLLAATGAHRLALAGHYSKAEGAGADAQSSSPSLPGVF